MLTELESALKAVTDEFPEAVRLALDAWQLATEKGVEYGVSYARNLLVWLRESKAAFEAERTKWKGRPS